MEDKDSRDNRELLIEMKGLLENLQIKMDERKEYYHLRFTEHATDIKQNSIDIDNAFSKVHKLENNDTKNQSEISNLITRVVGLEKNIDEMKDTLIRVSVVATIMTSGITGLVVKFFSG